MVCVTGVRGGEGREGRKPRPSCSHRGKACFFRLLGGPLPAGVSTENCGKGSGSPWHEARDAAFQLLKSQPLLPPQCDTLRALPRGPQRLFSPRPSCCEAARQGSPDLQNKPRSRPQRQRWLPQPGPPRVTHSAESKSKPGFGS